MARTKQRWAGRVIRNVFRDGGSVVLMARLEHDPDRVVELRVNRSSAEALVKAIMKAAELEPESANGKHAAEDTF